ncbi:MAG: hypothetical protein KatS3mg126_2318 [Lysobacteraceae bacterium]|nr:MAG: hypothetical protein KatS3mg126_2318 [Xanthomonadaceae bacterium]
MRTTEFPVWRLGDGPPAELVREQGFALLGPEATRGLCGSLAMALDTLPVFWEDLPLDEYLRDGGRYRRRRHASLRVQPPAIEIAPRRPHWQPLEYNALHGGLQRWFAPCSEAFLAAPALRALLRGLAQVFQAAAGRTLPFVELHQFRIDTSEGIGRPTPEGAHRDGVDYVAVVLVARHAVRGGETRVFQADGPAGIRFVMDRPWTALLLDDARMIHETTPLQPDGAPGWRDTLVLTFRADGFLDPPEPGEPRS